MTVCALKAASTKPHLQGNSLFELVQTSYRTLDKHSQQQPGEGAQFIFIFT